MATLEASWEGVHGEGFARFLSVFCSFFFVRSLSLSLSLSLARARARFVLSSLVVVSSKRHSEASL